MSVVSASQFARSFGRLQDEAFSQPIQVTSHGRVIGAYISAAEFEHFERLKRREAQSLVVGELPDDLVEAIEGAKYGVGPE
jgi:hypothetical protein